MEADWEFDLGADSPVIEGHWAGWIDLRKHPQLAFRLPETASSPALARALERLNSADSPVWTAKCDLYPKLEPDEFDAGELDAPPEAATTAMACYIDLLPSRGDRWLRPEQVEQACLSLCSRLRPIPLRCCRVDLVIRGAILDPQREGLGVTAYVTGCGPDPGAAASVLEAALDTFAESVAAMHLPSPDLPRPDLP